MHRLRIFYGPDVSGGGGASSDTSGGTTSGSGAAPSGSSTTPSVGTAASGGAPTTQSTTTPKAPGAGSTTAAAPKGKASPAPSGTPAKPAPVGGSAPQGTPVAANRFDLSKWDGEIDSLPAEHREIARLVEDRRVSSIKTEFETKSAELERARKEFAETGEPAFKSEIETLKKDLELYRALAEGSEDPRVKDLGEEIEVLRTSSKSYLTRAEKAEKALKERDEADTRKWADDFKTRYKDMLADEGKKTQFFGLCEQGWEEEAAALLVGASKTLLEEAASIVKTLNMGPEGHMHAIQHAKMRLGITGTPRQPRPAAVVTNGADGAGKTGARVAGGSVRDLPRDQARSEAAAAAWKTINGGRK